jgi:hypothetical protein
MEIEIKGFWEGVISSRGNACFAKDACFLNSFDEKILFICGSLQLHDGDGNENIQTQVQQGDYFLNRQ